jgi:hypothetical protein
MHFLMRSDDEFMKPHGLKFRAILKALYQQLKQRISAR